MAGGASDVPLTEDDCKINTVDNTNNKDTVYDIDIAYTIYNIYLILTYVTNLQSCFLIFILLAASKFFTIRNPSTYK